jgi:hypothetical protein
MRRSAEASCDSGAKAGSTLPAARRTIRCHWGATVAAITPAATANAPAKTRTLTTATIEPTPWQASEQPVDNSLNHCLISEFRAGSIFADFASPQRR